MKSVGICHSISNWFGNTRHERAVVCVGSNSCEAADIQDVRTEERGWTSDVCCFYVERVSLMQSRVCWFNNIICSWKSWCTKSRRCYQARSWRRDVSSCYTACSLCWGVWWQHKSNRWILKNNILRCRHCSFCDCVRINIATSGDREHSCVLTKRSWNSGGDSNFYCLWVK